MITMNKRSLTIREYEKRNDKSVHGECGYFAGESSSFTRNDICIEQNARGTLTQLNPESMIDQFEFRSICLR